jgi:cell division protein ZapA
MATVNVIVNGRPYSVGCEDGQEAHVQSLAHDFDRQVQEVGGQVGQVGDLRLFLMAALVTPKGKHSWLNCNRSAAAPAFRSQTWIPIHTRFWRLKRRRRGSRRLSSGWDEARRR